MHDFRLKVFYTVARHLNFSKAATELFITQPAATQHVKEMERQYETRLFDRKGNRIALTAAGEKMLEYAEKVFALHRQLEGELQASKEQLAGSLRIGASATIAQYVIPEIMSSFYGRHPEVEFSLFSGNTEQVAEALSRGQIDLGLVEGPVSNRDLKEEWFTNDELIAVASGRSELAKASPIALEQIPQLPWVLRERGSGTREVFEQVLESHGIKRNSIRVVMVLSSIEAIKSFLESGVGLSFLSKQSIRNELTLGLLQVVPVQGLKIERNFNFLYPQGPRPGGLVGEFIRFAKRFANHNN